MELDEGSAARVSSNCDGVKDASFPEARGSKLKGAMGVGSVLEKSRLQMRATSGWREEASCGACPEVVEFA